MKGMILAAGIGSRLRPLTDTVPKALVDVGGMTMLERAALKLKAAGVTDLVVNVHHHAEKVAGFVAAKGGFGMRTQLSREDDLLLDTGGGLKKAWPLIAAKEPFLVYNVDIITDLDLKALLAAHKPGSLATLAVQDRPTTRKLAFTADGYLKSRAAEGLAYNGVQVVSPALFPELAETGVFSIMEAYLRLAAAGRRIGSYQYSDYWADIGDMAKLEKARARK